MKLLKPFNIVTDTIYDHQEQYNLYFIFVWKMFKFKNVRIKDAMIDILNKKFKN